MSVTLLPPPSLTTAPSPPQDPESALRAEADAMRRKLSPWVERLADAAAAVVRTRALLEIERTAGAACAAAREAAERHADAHLRLLADGRDAESAPDGRVVGDPGRWRAARALSAAAGGQEQEAAARIADLERQLEAREAERATAEYQLRTLSSSALTVLRIRHDLLVLDVSPRPGTAHAPTAVPASLPDAGSRTTPPAAPDRAPGDGGVHRPASEAGPRAAPSVPTATALGDDPDGVGVIVPPTEQRARLAVVEHEAVRLRITWRDTNEALASARVPGSPTALHEGLFVRRLHELDARLAEVTLEASTLRYHLLVDERAESARRDEAARRHRREHPDAAVAPLPRSVCAPVLPMTDRFTGAWRLPLHACRGCGHLVPEGRKHFCSTGCAEHAGYMPDALKVPSVEL